MISLFSLSSHVEVLTSYSIIREPSTPQRHQSRSRQNERNAQDLGSPKNRCIPTPPQGVTFHGQKYNNFPDNIIAGIQRVQTLEQINARARGLQNVYSATQVSIY